jgi:hypothetical protein
VPLNRRRTVWTPRIVFASALAFVLVATQGDAAGSGGTPVSIGGPSGVSGHGIAAAVAGDNAIVVTNWNTAGTTFARYVNVVRR